MNLAIDIGNTRIKFGVFRGDTMIDDGICGSIEELQDRTAQHSIQQAIVSSVRRLSEEQFGKFEKMGSTLILDHNTPLPISLEYRTPETLGPDRVAAVVGCHSMFQGQNSLVIDAGTCITADYITSNGTYKGGHIAPGMKMRLQAMHHFTSGLPSIEKTYDAEVIGTSTVDCMLSGAQNGTSMEINGFIDWYEAQFGHVRVVMTGGDAVFFARKLKREIFVHSHLTLIGLNVILAYNDRKSD